MFTGHTPFVNRIVRLLEVGRVPRSIGALIVVAGALLSIAGIGLSLRGPVQNWLTNAPQQFARLEERLRPITSLFEKVQAASAQLERATAPKDSPAVQTVALARPGLAGLLSSGSPHVVSTVVAVSTGLVIAKLFF